MEDGHLTEKVSYGHFRSAFRSLLVGLTLRPVIAQPMIRSPATARVIVLPSTKKGPISFRTKLVLNFDFTV